MILPSELARMAACGGGCENCACESCSKKAVSSVSFAFNGQIKGFLNISGFDASGKRVAGPVMIDPSRTPLEASRAFKTAAEEILNMTTEPGVSQVRVGIS